MKQSKALESLMLRVVTNCDRLVRIDFTAQNDP